MAPRDLGQRLRARYEPFEGVLRTAKPVARELGVNEPSTSTTMTPAPACSNSPAAAFWMSRWTSLPVRTRPGWWNPPFDAHRADEIHRAEPRDLDGAGRDRALAREILDEDSIHTRLPGLRAGLRPESWRFDWLRGLPAFTSVSVAPNLHASCAILSRRLVGAYWGTTPQFIR